MFAPSATSKSVGGEATACGTSKDNMIGFFSKGDVIKCDERPVGCHCQIPRQIDETFAEDGDQRSEIVLSRRSRVCRAHGREDISEAVVDTEKRRHDAVPEEYLLIKDRLVVWSGLGEDAKPF